MGSHSSNWVKIIYERDTYVIRLSSISVFSYASNGKITFWLPESGIPIVLTPQINAEAYEKVLTYIEQVIGQTLP